MSGRTITAGGKVYNPDDFVCEWCKTKLVLDTYYTIDGKNVCQSCRNKERCASCGFLITETKYVTVDDKTFHPDCFRCSECLIELPGKFHYEDNLLFCGECINLRGATGDAEDGCSKCFLPLSGGIIKALGNRYHEDCFVCHSCFGPFPNDEFVNVKGNPYCDPCIDNDSYLKSTAHLKATGQTPAARSIPASSTGSGSGANGSGSGYGSGAPGSGSGSGYGSNSGSDYGSGAPGSGSGSGYGSGAPGSGSGSDYGSGSGSRSMPGSGSDYGSGAPGSGSGSGSGAPGSGSGSDYGSGAPGSGSDYGSGAPGSGSDSRSIPGSGSGSDYGSGAPGSGSGYGSGAPGSGSDYGSGAPGAGSGYGSGAPGSGSGSGYGSGAPGSSSGAGKPEIKSVSTPDDEYATEVKNSYLNPAGLPPKGPSKYDQQKKFKYGGGMKEEKKQRDFKSKAALGMGYEADHLKDMEGLGYKTIGRKTNFKQ